MCKPSRVICSVCGADIPNDGNCWYCCEMADQGRIVCCVCGGVQMGTWEGPGDSHGYCPKCLKEAKAEAKRAVAEWKVRKR